MSGRQGGKLKPLKAPKKGPAAELDDDDKALAEKRKAEALEMKAAKERAAKGGLGGGIKKSSGKK